VPQRAPRLAPPRRPLSPAPVPAGAAQAGRARACAGARARARVRGHAGRGCGCSRETRHPEGAPRRRIRTGARRAWAQARACLMAATRSGNAGNFISGRRKPCRPPARRPPGHGGGAAASAPAGRRTAPRGPCEGGRAGARREDEAHLLAVEVSGCVPEEVRLDDLLAVLLADKRRRVPDVDDRLARAAAHTVHLRCPGSEEGAKVAPPKKRHAAAPAAAGGGGRRHLRPAKVHARRDVAEGVGEQRLRKVRRRHAQLLPPATVPRRHLPAHE